MLNGRTFHYRNTYLMFTIYRMVQKIFCSKSIFLLFVYLHNYFQTKIFPSQKKTDLLKFLKVLIGSLQDIDTFWKKNIFDFLMIYHSPHLVWNCRSYKLPNLTCLTSLPKLNLTFRPSFLLNVWRTEYVNFFIFKKLSSIMNLQILAESMMQRILRCVF